MILKLLTEHHLQFLSFIGGFTCSSESTLVKMPYCWKSHATAHMIVKLLTEHLLEVLSLKGGCTGSSESTFVKMTHC